jgi:hypothetical protein
MAAISMTFALHIALGVNVAAAVPFAIAWGLAILSLDRWLVATISRKQLLLAIPRALLGLLFGVIISTPLTLQIFHAEIANQIAVDHTKAEAAYEASAAVTKLNASVSADQQKVDGYQAVIANGGAGSITPPSHDQLLVQLQAGLRSDQDQVTKYQRAAHCEEFGGSDCSSSLGGNVVAGAGTNYKYDIMQADYYNGLVQSAEQRIAAEQKSLAQENRSNEANAVRNAHTDLVPAQAKLAKAQAALNTLKDAYETSLGNDTGILANLQALDHLRMSNPVVFTAEFLLFLFFTTIEWLPIGVKVLLSLGPENTYEKALAIAEQAVLESAASALPEMMRGITEARLAGIRAKRTGWKQVRSADVSPNGLAHSDWTRYRNDLL